MENKVFFYVLKEFFLENKVLLSLLVLIAVVNGVIQTNGITDTSAKLIDTIGNSSPENIWYLFAILAAYYGIYQLLLFGFWQIDNTLVNKIKPWARYKLIDLVMLVNSNFFSEVNFTRLNSPIHRLADLISQIISDVIAYFLPNIIFVFIVGAYLLKLDPAFTGIFLVGNIFIGLFYYLTFETTLKNNMKYEKMTQKADGSLIDILSNMDKIVYRGNNAQEAKDYQKIADDNATLGADYYCTSNRNSTIMSFILLIVFLVSVAYLIKMYFNKKVNNMQFIATISILTLFRERLDSVFNQIPDFIGYIGRMNIAFNYFKHINIHLDEVLSTSKYKNKKLKFDKIKFKNVNYKYNTGKTVFKDKNIDIELNNHNIIGVTGPSGCGKSTLMKLLIKMYPPNDGEIFIDDINIKTLEPNYIRKHVTYVNQNSKLFDKKVIDNMLYGCIDDEKCNIYLKKIMKYPNIKKLYENVDIKNKDSGLLGENLSGGQRQVVNMIGGLINPTEILILDEPTNALDPDLKKEVIQIIQDFKQHKKGIFIITHDRDVFNIFDKQIKM